MEDFRKMLDEENARLEEAIRLDAEQMALRRKQQRERERDERKRRKQPCTVIGRIWRYLTRR